MQSVIAEVGFIALLVGLFAGLAFIITTITKKPLPQGVWYAVSFLAFLMSMSERISFYIVIRSVLIGATTFVFVRFLSNRKEFNK